MKSKFFTIVCTVLLICVLFSYFRHGSFSSLSIIDSLSRASDLVDDIGDVDEILLNVYRVAPELANFTISADWGAFNFLRVPLQLLVRIASYVLDLGNYAVWFVSSCFVGFVYAVSLLSVLIGLA